MSVMAILQEVDKCMRCNGCVTACKREWDMKLPTNIADVKPARSVVSPRQRLAIKSVKRGDMGPFLRFTCWHCPDPPCKYACPFKAIKKETTTGAVSVDNTKCNPTACKVLPGPKPCETACQRGGYPKVGYAYETGTYAALTRMNKCTLCTGRAGADADPNLNASTALPTRATIAEVTAVPEKAHEPACVFSCPAKAMKWDTRDNILTYLRANYGTNAAGSVQQMWVGNGSMFWASKKTLLPPPKADPFVEDHIAPMTSSMLSNGSLLVPTLVLGGLAMLAARKTQVAEEAGVTGEEA